MDPREGKARSLVVQIYSSSGVLSGSRPASTLSCWLSYFKSCGMLLAGTIDIPRKLFQHALYRIRCFLHQHYWKSDFVRFHGMLCWDLHLDCNPAKTLKTATSAGCRTNYRTNCLALFDEICDAGSSELLVDQTSPLMTYVRIPRDIVFIYTDKDPNTIRKVELCHGVRIFHGRDFERGRDRDRPAAPRGTARLCIYGRYKNIMAAKLEMFGWMEIQADFKEEEVLVPEYAAGNVIGRQGSRVAKMEVESKARIDVQTRDERSKQEMEDIRVIISGRRPARDAARKLIQECVAHSERMREKDKIRDTIRDVRRRIQYGLEDDDDDEALEEEALPQSEPVSPSVLLFKPRSVLVAEARATALEQRRNPAKIPRLTQWGGVPLTDDSTIKEAISGSWGDSSSTWAESNDGTGDGQLKDKNNWSSFS